MQNGRQKQNFWNKASEVSISNEIDLLITNMSILSWLDASFPVKVAKNFKIEKKCQMTEYTDIALSDLVYYTFKSSCHLNSIFTLIWLQSCCFFYHEISTWLIIFVFIFLIGYLVIKASRNRRPPGERRISDISPPLLRSSGLSKNLFL